MKSKLRVGVIGIGFGQAVIVPAFAGEPDCEVTAICAGSADRARRVADRLGLPKAYGSWEELVADPEIDAVTIATPPTVQPTIAMAALTGGKHIFCEKPLASNLEAAAELLAVARSSGMAHMVNFEFPEIGAWQRAKSVLDSGSMGKLSHATVSWDVETYANRMGIRSWKTDAGLGGGTLNSFVSHTFHYLEWLIGPIRQVGARLFSPAALEGFGDTQDVLWLEHQNGVVSSLSVSGNAFLGTGHRVAIYGQEGSLVLDNPSRDYAGGFSLWHGTRETKALECIYREPVQAVEIDGRIAPVNLLVKRFVKWVREGIPSTPNIEDGFRVQRLLDASRRSSDACRGIELA